MSAARSCARSHLGLCVAADDEELGEAKGDVVDFADLKFRDVVILKIAIAVLRDLDDADAQMVAYRCIQIRHARSGGDGV